MSCPLCGFRFFFKEPFHDCSRFICPECENEVDIPDQIIEEFLDNIDFLDYLNRRRKPRGGGNTKAPPPATN
jgi:hypothetical protein